MQTYDIVMLAVLVIATGYGFWKGMAWQIAQVSSLIVSYFAALRLADQVAPHISAPPPLNKFVAMLLIYMACSALIWVVFQFVRGALDQVHLRDFDRQAGGLCGALKGALYCVVITFFAVTLSASARESVLHSRSGYYVALFIHRATPVMPTEVRELLGPYIDRLERGLDPNQPAAPLAGDQILNAAQQIHQQVKQVTHEVQQFGQPVGVGQDLQARPNPGFQPSGGQQSGTPGFQQPTQPFQAQGVSAYQPQPSQVYQPQTRPGFQPGVGAGYPPPAGQNYPPPGSQPAQPFADPYGAPRFANPVPGQPTERVTRNPGGQQF